MTRNCDKLRNSYGVNFAVTAQLFKTSFLEKNTTMFHLERSSVRIQGTLAL